MKQRLLLACSLIGLAVSLILPNAVHATSFNAGNIIGDVEFTDKNSMSAADIQHFLNSKNSVCLKNYTTQEPLGNNTYGGNVSAARAIWKAGQLFNINPKVLLVTLQKEQGLITRTDCPQWRYQTALGYGCPDTAPCSTFGFSVQLYQGARHFRGFFDQTPGWYIPYTPGVRYIQYNPSTSCGGSNVNIQNRATASLYSYTPYQPNSATLAAPIGQTVHCGAYGNKNFWYYYNAWFKVTPFFQLPRSVRTYIMGANNTYYYIQSPEIMRAYGYGSKFNEVNQRANANGLTFAGDLPVVSRFEDIGVYAIDGGKRSPFPSEATFYNHGYDFGEEARLPKWVKDYLPINSPVENIIKLSDGATVYSIENGKKRAICNEPSFTKLGSPVYSSRPSVRLGSNYVRTIPNGAPVAINGDLILSTDTNQYGIWQNGQYTPMNAAIARSTGAVSCGVPSSAVNQLPKSQNSINNLVKDTSGNRYVINSNQRLLVNDSAAQAYGIQDQNPPIVTNDFLSKLRPSSLPMLVRVNNGIAVYVIKEGKSHPVPSESDLFGLGYSFANVQNITQSTFGLAKKDGLIFAQGKIVRESGSPGVYLVNSTTMKRHPFTSEQSFFNYGYTWNNVSVVATGSLSAYKVGQSMHYFIQEDDGNYWLMDRGKKRRILGNLVDDSHFAASRSATPLPASILSRFAMSDPLTKVFRATNGPGVYLIENGKKRVFASEAALFRHGYTWNNVRVLSPSFVQSIPTGQPIF